MAVNAWFVAILPVLLALVGLGLDGGQVVVARAEVQAVADAAARGAASQLDTRVSSPLRAETGSPAELDVAAADGVARAYVAMQGARLVDIRADQQQVRVRVGRTVPMVFLRIVRLNSLWIEALGVAHPRRSPGGP